MRLCCCLAAVYSAPSIVWVDSMAAFVAKGYQGFGSFHSDNVEELIRIPDDQYVQPANPVASQSAPIESVQFGADARRQFCIDFTTWTFINHGAFGAPCRFTLAESRAWSDYCESQPLRFIDRELFSHMCHSIRRLAKEVNASPTTVALVPNATYALNSVIHAVCTRMPSTSSVFLLDIGYGSVKKIASEALGGGFERVVVATVTFPLTTQEAFVEQVLSQLPEHVGLVVLDHVTSNSALVLPIELLMPAIRAARPHAQILIDGAHGLGAFQLDLATLQPDYYVANAHKWLCSARGLGMLYAAPQHTSIIHSPVVSHGHGSGFTSELVWDGNRDKSAALALPGLLDWWKAQGGLEAARQYCRSTLASAVASLCAAWGTCTQSPLPFYSHMACVQIPPQALPPGAAKLREGGDPTDPEAYDYSCTSTHGKMLQDALHFVFHIECPVKTLPGPRGNADMRSYVRISAQVYNASEDYAHLCAAVMKIGWEERADGAVMFAVRGSAGA